MKILNFDQDTNGLGNSSERKNFKGASRNLKQTICFCK